MLKGLIMAFSMYSRIPMPHIAFREENMRYVMVFFPAVGLVIGLVQWLAFFLTTAAKDSILRACCLMMLPLLISGGIHFDGFLDTTDAVHSYGDAVKKRQILKDPHMGAFAFLYGTLYLLLSFALWHAAVPEAVPALGCGYVLSRILSGASVLTFPKSQAGSVRNFSDKADSRAVMMLIAEGVILLAFLFCIADIRYALAVSLSQTFVFVYYRFRIVPAFGGTSGDLCGWFLSVAELVMLMAAVLVSLMP